MLSAICHNNTAWWWVRIHNTQTDLIRHANQLARRRHTHDQQPDDTLACFQPAGFWYHVDPDGTMTPHPRNGYVGTMRLTADNLTTEIVTHECVHLALRIYRGRHNEHATLGTDCGPAEENLAYIIGQTVTTMTDLLHNLGLWT